MLCLMTWDIDSIGRHLKYAKSLHGIEGVTFWGGEPMLQAKGLAEIAQGCKRLKLSVMVFTGYTLEDLIEKPPPGVVELLDHTDLLIDGSFMPGNIEQARNWAGSTNQRFHFITDRYKAGVEYDPAYSYGFEMRLFGDGSVRSNGWPFGNILDGKN